MFVSNRSFFLRRGEHHCNPSAGNQTWEGWSSEGFGKNRSSQIILSTNTVQQLWRASQLLEKKNFLFFWVAFEKARAARINSSQKDCSRYNSAALSPLSNPTARWWWLTTSVHTICPRRTVYKRHNSKFRARIERLLSLKHSSKSSKWTLKLDFSFHCWFS